MFRRLLCCISVVLCFNTFANSDNTLSIQSKVMDENVSLQIALPDTYLHSDTFHYPLLIVLDGSTQFKHVAASSQFLSTYGIIPEMLVVGLNLRERLKYYTHTEHPDYKGRSGYASTLEQFITSELLPTLGKKHRIAPYILITGHSLSGLFTSYLALNNTAKINGVISISPSLWYDDKELVRNFERYSKNRSNSPVKWFLSLASEPGEMKQAYEAMLQKLNNASPKKLLWSSANFPQETHDSTPLIGNAQALKSIFDGWNAVPEIEVMPLNKLQAFYSEKASEYGYNFPLSVHQYNVYGLKAAYEGKTAWGVEILEQGVIDFNLSEILWDSLATAYSMHGDNNKALTASNKALELAKQKGSVFLNEIISQNKSLKTRASAH